jgi:hypothetical protein
MPKLSLPWPVDREGYRIEKVGGGRTIAEPSHTLIVRNGGPLDFIDVMKIDGLYHRLADCPATAEGALSFVRRYGFLRRGDGDSENHDDITHTIRVVRSLLKIKEAGNWERLHLWVINNPKIGLLRPELLAGEPPELFFRPVTLHDAIYLQFLGDLTASANLRKCKRPGCGEWFNYGPGTQHRNTALYCSPKCQNADKYMKRKEGAA